MRAEHSVSVVFGSLDTVRRVVTTRPWLSSWWITAGTEWIYFIPNRLHSQDWSVAGPDGVLARRTLMTADELIADVRLKGVGWLPVRSPVPCRITSA